MSNLETWLNPPVVWFLIGLLLMLLEFVGPGIVIVFFGIGAWAVALLCLFANPSLNAQLALFLVVSVTLLGLLRRRFQMLFHKGMAPTSTEEEVLEEFIGKRATVTEKIAPNVVGKVEFRGTYWEAEADQLIPKGALVEIVGKTNLTLKVKSI